MQTQSARDTRRRRLLLFIGAVLAIVAASATYLAATRPSAGPQPTPTPVPKAVVVAALDIGARTEITAAMLISEQVPDGPAYANAITDPSVAVGQVALVDIPAGEVIKPNLVGSATVAGIDILAPGETISPDSPAWRAVSISIPADRAVAGLVAPGDWIDLFVTVEIRLYDETGALTNEALPGGYIPGMATKITWTNVQVLSADAERNLYVMRVNERQAEEIAHVQASGPNSFTMSLRPAGDNRAVDTTELGQTLTTIVDAYGIPIPQVLFLPNLGPIPGPTPPPDEEPTESPAPSP